MMTSHVLIKAYGPDFFRKYFTDNKLSYFNVIVYLILSSSTLRQLMLSLLLWHLQWQIIILLSLLIWRKVIAA